MDNLFYLKKKMNRSVKIVLQLDNLTMIDVYNKLYKLYIHPHIFDVLVLHVFSLIIVDK